MSVKGGVMTVRVISATVPPSERATKQASVKVELRKTADDKEKKKTIMRPVNNGKADYVQDFEFDVDANYIGELRVQLCKKNESIMAGKAVVANAGIYVKNIVSHINQHGTIDKEFTLFAKDGKAAGGSVHLRIDFVSDKDAPKKAISRQGTVKSHTFTEDEAATKLQNMKESAKTKSKGPGGIVVAGLLAIVVAIGALSMKKKEPEPAPKGKGRK